MLRPIARMLRHVPGVRQWYEEVRRLRAEVDLLSSRTTAPEERPGAGLADTIPFSAYLRATHLEGPAYAAMDTARETPRRKIPFKLSNYAIAQSHGVQIPELYGIWARLEDVRWDDLPETFVLKSNGGASARGVFPLRRIGDRLSLIDGTATYTTGELLDAAQQRRGVTGPWFAEEVLTPMPGAGESPLPDDVKIFSFYGRVGHTLVRHMPKHGDVRASRVRYLGEDGSDLGDIDARRPADPTVRAPQAYAEMVAIAQRLSAAVPLPFIRVDLYETPRGIVFGELTLVPGGRTAYRADHDALLGSLWADARRRLELDLARGRPYDLAFGPHDRELRTEAAR